MIKIITDSASDIPKEYENKYNIEIMPIPITIGEQTYYERRDFNSMEFYDILSQSDILPVTSHITMAEIQKRYKKAYEDGYDEIIHISLTSTGSNMFQSALMAKKLFYDSNVSLKDKIKIYTIDSKTYSYAYGRAVVKAAQMVTQGKTCIQIINYLEDYFNRVELYFSVYSLEYAKKSGRITIAATFIGEALGLRPIISMIDGQMKIVGRVRGDKKIPDELASKVKTNIDKEIDNEYCILVGKLENEDMIINQIKQTCTPQNCIDIFKLGASILINSGPQTLGVSFMGKKRN